MRVHVGQHDVAVDGARRSRSTSSSGAKTAAIAPGSSTWSEAISRPRALTASRASSKRQDAGRDQGAVLAEAVAHHEVGLDPVGRQQAGQRDVDGQHGRLGDLRLAQLLLGRRDRVGVGRVDEDDVAQRAPVEQRAHDPVGLGEGLRDDRLGLHAGSASMFAYWEPWPVNRKATFCGGPAPRKMPRARSAFHAAGLPPASAFERQLAPRRQLVGVAEVDGHPLARAQVRRVGRRGRRHAAPPAPRAAARASAASSSAPRTSAPRTGGFVEVGAPRAARPPSGRWAGRRRAVTATDGAAVALLAVEPPGHVLLEHGVEVRPAEAEGADTGNPRLAVARLPLAQLGVDRERRPVPVDVRVGALEVEARRQDLVVERERRLEQTRRAGRALEVADVRLHGPERDAARRQVGAGEHLAQALDLDHVADARRRPVALDHAAAVGRRGRPSPRRAPPRASGRPGWAP